MCRNTCSQAQTAESNNDTTSRRIYINPDDLRPYEEIHRELLQAQSEFEKLISKGS